MDTKDIIGAVGTLFAIVLGLYNFWAARRGDQVRLLITPKASTYLGKDSAGRDFYKYTQNGFDFSLGQARNDTLAVDVVNVSKFPVTIKEVGLKSRWRKERIALVNPILLDGKPWPRRLEAREAVTVHFTLPQLLESKNLGQVTHAYAYTNCGASQLGKTAALQELIAGLTKRA